MVCLVFWRTLGGVDDLFVGVRECVRECGDWMGRLGDFEAVDFNGEAGEDVAFPGGSFGEERTGGDRGS